MEHYTIQRATTVPALDGDWDGPAWGRVPALPVAHFHDKSSDHRPITEARLLYDETGFYVIFRVDDRYVRSVELNRNGQVCRDSCVEFFVEPVAGRGYFNFEINCGGTLLLHYNARSATTKFDPVELDQGRLELVKIYHSLPRTVDPEMTEPVTWEVEFFSPYDLFESFVGSVPRGPGAIWRANLYKCADATSHPHWAMWNAIPGALGFHKPEFFAPLQFSGPLTPDP